MSSSGLLQRICGSDTDEAEEDTVQPAVRQQAMGILATDDDTRSCFTDSDIECFFVEVSKDQLAQLSDTDWFDTAGHDGRKAVAFARRFDAETQTTVRVTDTIDSFEVKIEAVIVTEITNETIEEFCQTFSHSIATQFDPLGESHDDPRMVIQPW